MATVVLILVGLTLGAIGIYLTFHSLRALSTGEITSIGVLLGVYYLLSFGSGTTGDLRLSTVDREIAPAVFWRILIINLVCAGAVFYQAVEVLRGVWI